MSAFQDLHATPSSPTPIGRRSSFGRPLTAWLATISLLGALAAQAQVPQTPPGLPTAPALTPQPPPHVGGPEPETPSDLQNPPEDAYKFPSGLVTKAVQKGTGDVHPDENDLVSIHYVGWTPYGAKFQSSYSRQPSVFNLTKLMPVWKQAIMQMVVGESRRLWIPAHLAPESDNAPRGPVVFQFELLGINDIPDPPKELRTPPEDAKQSDYGVFSRVLKEGDGDTHPGADDLALMHWTGWGVGGKTFESTYYRGRPTAFPLDKVMEPFADIVQQMVVGEKRQIWIPAALANGQWPGAPRGQLILEVELVTIMPGDVLQAARPQTESGSQ